MSFDLDWNEFNNLIIQFFHEKLTNEISISHIIVNEQAKLTIGNAVNEIAKVFGITRAELDKLLKYTSRVFYLPDTEELVFLLPYRDTLQHVIIPKNHWKWKIDYYEKRDIQ